MNKISKSVHHEVSAPSLQYILPGKMEISGKMSGFVYPKTSYYLVVIKNGVPDLLESLAKNIPFIK